MARAIAITTAAAAMALGAAGPALAAATLSVACPPYHGVQRIPVRAFVSALKDIDSVRPCGTYAYPVVRDHRWSYADRRAHYSRGFRCQMTGLTVHHAIWVRCHLLAGAKVGTPGAEWASIWLRFLIVRSWQE
jgi:hypothetical protein